MPNFFKKFFVSLVCVFVIAFKAFAFEAPHKVFIQTSQKKILVNVALAIDMPTQRKGLMYVDDLKNDQGMLFVYPQEKERIFWMKNTPTALDILFVSKEKKIIAISQNTKPYSAHKIYSNLPAQYVLEVKAGFVKQNSIQIGSTLIFDLK